MRAAALVLPDPGGPWMARHPPSSWPANRTAASAGPSPAATRRSLALPPATRRLRRGGLRSSRSRTARNWPGPSIPWSTTASPTRRTAPRRSGSMSGPPGKRERGWCGFGRGAPSEAHHPLDGVERTDRPGSAALVTPELGPLGVGVERGPLPMPSLYSSATDRSGRGIRPSGRMWCPSRCTSGRRWPRCPRTGRPRPGH